MSSRLDEHEVNPDIDQRQYFSLNDEKAAAAAAAEQDDDDVTESSIFNTHGLRVLAVDDSVVCLKILVALLRQCKYNVTETTNPVEALQILRTRKHEFDIVITDLRMLEMDGLVLLQKVSLEMDLPVVMLSADDKHENIMKAIRYGARDYLIKPPRMAQIQNVWQHVVRRRLFGPNCKDVNNTNNTSSITKEEEETPSPPKFNESKRKLHETEGDHSGKACVEAESSECSKKKKRVNWTPDLHNKFTDAIERIGPKAVPMEILKLMNVPGLTRANVASHLQKFKNAIRSQAHCEPQARNVYSNNVNYAAGRNGYQSSVNSLHASYSMGMMIQAIGTNPYLPQKLSFHQNNQNSRIFPEAGVNQHLMTYGEHYNLPTNPPASLAPAMLNNAPLPPRKVLTNQPPVPRFDGLMFSTTGNNMTNSYPSSQPLPALPSAPALFPSHTTYPSEFAGNMPIAISSALNAYSRQNDMQRNGQNYLETENIYPQLNWAVTSDFLDTSMRNSNTRTSNFVVDPFQTTQMETWSTNNNSVVNPAHISAPFETSNLSNSNNMKVEVQHFHNTTHEELHIDASFQPISTNLSDEDDNDELNSMVNSFKFEVPPSL